MTSTLIKEHETNVMTVLLYSQVTLPMIDDNHGIKIANTDHL